MARRFRVERQTPASSIKRKMTMLADSIENLQEEIQEKQKKLKDELRELEELMKKYKVQKHEGNISIAEFVVPPGRSTRIIDPVKFREKVQDDRDFFSAISVSVTKAKKVLSEKEIDSISDIRPPKEKEPILKVRHK